MVPSYRPLAQHEKTPVPMLLLPTLLALASPAAADDSAEFCNDLSDSGGCTVTAEHIITSDRVVDLRGKAVTIVSGGAIIVDGYRVTIEMGGLTVLNAGRLQGRGPSTRLNLFVSEHVVFSGTADFKGSEGGGTLDIYAGLNIEVNTSGENYISAAGSIESPSAAGGVIELYAARDLTIMSDIDVDGRDEAKGGTLILTAEGSLIRDDDGTITGVEGGTINLTGDLELSGGSGGGGVLLMSGGHRALVACTDLGEATESPASIHLESRTGGGPGGSMWISRSGTACVNADLNTNASGAIASASAGSVVIDEEVGTIAMYGSLTSKAGGPAGVGGTVWLEAKENIVVSSQTDLSSEVASGQAGLFDAVAGNELELNGDIFVHTKDLAGEIRLASIGDMRINSDLHARKFRTKGDGGTIVVASLGGTLMATQSVKADGKSDQLPSDVRLYGCAIQMGPDAEIVASGELGTVDITGIDTLNLLGTIDAGDEGRVIFRSSDDDVEGTIAGTVNPEAAWEFNSALISCGEEDRNPKDLDDDGHSPEILRGDDCDDTDPDVYPGADEIPDDDIDNDCDGEIDEAAETDDTGEPTGGDTGEPSTPSDDDTGSTPDIDTDDDGGSKEQGCSCSTGHAPGGLVILLGLLPWARRRAS